MPMNRRDFLAASLAGAAMLSQEVQALGDPPGNLQVAIDASQVSAPINPLVFSSYMEPATIGAAFRQREVDRDRRSQPRVQEIPAEIQIAGRYAGCTAGDSRHRQRRHPYWGSFTNAFGQRPGISRWCDQVPKGHRFPDGQMAGWELRLCLRLARRPRRSGLAPTRARADVGKCDRIE
jgi:hypothetical protein